MTKYLSVENKHCSVVMSSSNPCVFQTLQRYTYSKVLRLVFSSYPPPTYHGRDHISNKTIFFLFYIFYSFIFFIFFILFILFFFCIFVFFVFLYFCTQHKQYPPKEAGSSKNLAFPPYPLAEKHVDRVDSGKIAYT